MTHVPSQRAVSDLLRVLSASVNVFHNAKVCGRWQISEHVPPLTCFHVITEGECWLEVPNRLSTKMRAGDLIMFPVELPHTMTPVQDNIGPQEHIPLSQAVGREGTGLLCASVSFRHPASELLLHLLPEVTVLFAAETPWLTPLTTLILDESLKPGAASQAILEKLAELLFIYTLSSSHVMNSSQKSVLALYAHPRVGRAIDALHAKPEQAWTLDSLAREAAQSRTAFATTFKSISGWTVMEYVGWWRMQLAWKYLEEGARLSDIPSLIGFQSQPAFSRAFKRHFGVNPSAAR